MGLKRSSSLPAGSCLCYHHALMEPVVSPRKAELYASTFRRLVRRGAKGHISNLLAKTRPEDVARQLPGLTPSEQAEVFRILIGEYPENAGEVLTELDTSQQARVLEELELSEIAELFESMPVDDAVSVAEDLPEAVREKVDLVFERRDLGQVQEHLTYEDDSAGRIMDSEYLALREETTVGEAIDALRESQHTENVFYLYIVDKDQHLVGVTSLRKLLLSSPSVALAEIMTRSLIKVDTHTDQEDVAELATRYDLLSIPVTDGNNRLVGIVTVDDIIDVVQEEATEDFYKLVGTSDDELVYEDRSFRVAGIRLPWLLLNLAGLGFAGLLIHWFELRMEEALFLIPFVPVVMGMGGNIGSQTSTIAVRGLSTGRIVVERGWRHGFIWQQLKVGVVIGVVCAVLAAAAAYLLPRLGWLELDPGRISFTSYAVVVGASLFLAIVVASVNGAVVPIVFNRVGIDPAVASGPLVTTSNDITGIVIYFGLASLLIEYLLR